MGAYHQMGHDSQNLLAEEHLDSYIGAILSPVNYSEEKVKEQIATWATDTFEMIFDPQLYFPNSDRGELPGWSYFPADVDSADQGSRQWWEILVRDLTSAVERIRPHAVCSPAVVPRTYSDDYYLLNTEIAAQLGDMFSGKGVDVLQTLLVRLGELSSVTRAAEIASIASSGSADRVFLVLVSDVEPRRELCETEDLKGAMRLIRFLEGAHMRVLIGFCSSDAVLWKFAGATSCATGKFFNLRRFTPGRWDVPGEGGGQLPYWFEESVMAYLRDSDLARVGDADLLSSASGRNPYGQEILSQRRSEPELPWLGLSWRQYLYWFADFEQRFTNGEIVGDNILHSAEGVWSELDSRNILMEERQNDGAWLRAWRRAILEAFAE